ncbi:MAG: trigger factor [Caldisericia bacterium]|nr:trigger factor [Caldisericia bacterium]
MNIIEYFIEKNTANITLEFTPDEVNQYITNAYLEVNLQATLPGFRKGKAPLNVLKSRFPLSEMQEDILKVMAKDAVTLFLNEKKEEQFIDFPYMKSIEPLQENQTYQVKLFADIYPKVVPAEIGEKVFELTLPKMVAEIVQDKINALLETHATYNDMAKPDKQGYAIIEYAFSGNENVSAITSPKTKMIYLMEDSIQPGLNEKIMEMEIDSHVFFPIPNKEEEPKKYIYIKVIGWKKKELPLFNQEFLDAIQAGKQTDEYMSEINQAAEQEYDAAKKEATIGSVLDYLVVNSSFEVIPDNLYQKYLEKELENLESEVKKMKLTWEKYLEITKQTQESLEKEMEADLIKQIKLDLLFRYFAITHPELAPEEEKVISESKSLFDRFQQEGQDVDMQKLQNYMKENLRKGNIMDWLIKDVKTTIKSA